MSGQLQLKEVHILCVEGDVPTAEGFVDQRRNAPLELEYGGMFLGVV